MRTKIIFSFVVLISTINIFAQKQNDKPVYTFCGKSGDSYITFDELKNCKKELTPIDKNLKIISFDISVPVVPLKEKEYLFIYKSTVGNIFSETTTDLLEQFIAKKRLPHNRILIENVQVSQGDKIWKAAGMSIKLK
ncbi:MAG: hypothetical protein A3F72_03990 [Bacteroidetes bacterium RIFCSPLOWO2_12_FULL_35_15]|nr:MAG: hypothetical protein A3F72_03990 [Bacteroidetes bacterium RIFCSPLOWO2_12_FULL_35_15]